MAKESKSLEQLIQESNERSRKAGTLISDKERAKSWPKDSVLIETGNWLRRLASKKKSL